MESTKPRCALICVGSELLRGKINTHASTMARRLAGIGLELNEEATVSDEQPMIAEAIRRALARFTVVFVTGGLGPTFDDLTREASADATGRKLTLSMVLLKGIARKFRRARLRKMPPANARQAYVLDGAVAIENTAGTAPGQWLQLKDSGQLLILLPGPPSELTPMLDGYVLPQLRKKFPALPQAEAHLHFVGVPESFVDHRVRPIIEKAGAAVQFTILAHLGLVDLDIFVGGKTQAEANRTLRRLTVSIQRAVGPSFYGMDEDYPLEKVVGQQLRREKATLAVAESCTGGLLAARLTDIAGSSEYFLGGVVSYHNRVKQSELDVPAWTLKRYGAVSRQTAIAMAQGIRNRSGSTCGLSITGIAGPTGGTSKKPVGLVYMALAGPRGTSVQEFHFSGLRAAIRQRALIAALDVLRQTRKYL